TMIRNALVYKQADTTEVPQLFSEARETPARPYTATPASKGSAKQTISQNSEKPFDSSWFESAKAILSMKDNAPRQKDESPAKAPETGTARAPSVVTTTKIIPQYRYIGQVFNTFLVVEQEDKLLFIDQHALHERLLYDEIRSLRDVQRLIVHYSFEVERSVDDFLIKNSFIYSDFGIELTRREDLVWDMASIPAACRKNEEEIVSFIRNQTGDLDSVQKGLFAIIACHAAIKAGDPLDSVTATSLVKRCFELDRMVCPHGRDFTFSISKQELYRQVGRIV
ncbi:MAG: DNA mismatch repair protein MutL, partial [Spirochaetales bacterium]|nr:DNA mismatch repair protein MutL [Spirochaetales bacterium]